MGIGDLKGFLVNEGVKKGLRLRGRTAGVMLPWMTPPRLLFAGKDAQSIGKFSGQLAASLIGLSAGAVLRSPPTGTNPASGGA